MLWCGWCEVANSVGDKITVTFHASRAWQSKPIRLYSGAQRQSTFQYTNSQKSRTIAIESWKYRYKQWCESLIHTSTRNKVTLKKHTENNGTKYALFVPAYARVVRRPPPACGARESATRTTWRSIVEGIGANRVARSTALHSTENPIETNRRMFRCCQVLCITEKVSSRLPHLRETTTHTWKSPRIVTPDWQFQYHNLNSEQFVVRRRET